MHNQRLFFSQGFLRRFRSNNAGTSGRAGQSGGVVVGKDKEEPEDEDDSHSHDASLAKVPLPADAKASQRHSHDAALFLCHLFLSFFPSAL